MRIILKFKALKDFSYDEKYYSKLRGFVYGLMKESKYFNKHDKGYYKFFCYSNIFPVEDVKTGEERHFIISSPDSDFIRFLYGRIAEIKQFNKPVLIGESMFSIDEISYLKPFITEKASLITGTPIVMRIPKQNYHIYGIKSKRPYEYWRPEYDFNAFLKQISDNLVKKYNQYYSSEMKTIDLFEIFKFKKSVCVHRIEEGNEIPTIGSLWEFRFSHLDELKRRVLWLGLESGFGELNSSGFGFMNVVKT
ncbi:CRISPR-associated endoribonuclease Cas6 [Candidatus Woesearchaeota archaeon]|nr:CRISPR-associated endoribonuclease Cas6 [Candidatus Woesearchaeota archaeon]